MQVFGKHSTGKG